jgi:hypothetical protein
MRLTPTRGSRPRHAGFRAVRERATDAPENGGMSIARLNFVIEVVVPELGGAVQDGKGESNLREGYRLWNAIPPISRPKDNLTHCHRPLTATCSSCEAYLPDDASAQ